MFVVVKLGGCNGSGKTSVGRALIARDLKPVRLTPPKVTYYGGRHRPVSGNPVDIKVLGSYENVCGGMDTIGDKNDRFALVQQMCKPKHIVFFEGLITGKTYGALGELSEQHLDARKGRWLWAFMDTPFSVCVDRVLARRKAAGNDAPFDPERTMRSTFNSCDRLAQKLRGELEAPRGSVREQPVLMLDHTATPDQLADRVMTAALEMYREGF